MFHPPSMSDFVDDRNCQIMRNFLIVLFTTRMNALRNDGHISTFRNAMLDSLLQHKEALNVVAGEANMITVPLLQAVDVFVLENIL